MAKYKLTDSIFPVIDVNSNNAGLPVDGFFLGNCFYCSIAGHHIFVTVKHILMNKKFEDLAIAYIKDGKPNIIEIKGGQVINKNNDFMFFIPDGPFKQFAEKNFVPLTPMMNILPYGYNVISYGYPLTEREVDDQGRTILTISDAIFKGYIHAYWKESPWHSRSNVYALSFPALPGLSGSPILAGSNEQLQIAGIIYGHQSLGRILVEENRDGENIEKSYIGYEMGISSDYHPFQEIEKLLIDVYLKLGQNKADSSNE